MPNFHGLTAFVVMSSVAARFFGPQVPASAPRRAETRFSASITTRCSIRPRTCNISPRRRTLVRLQLAIRQRPGGRSGTLRGRQLRQRSERNGYNRGRLRPHARSAIPGRAVLRERFCTPTTPISPDSTSPATQYGSKFLKIPAPAPKTTTTTRRASHPATCSISPSGTTIFARGQVKGSARLTVVNLTNKEALYNFLSTFSGTHYVTPRAITATIGFHF